MAIPHSTYHLYNILERNSTAALSQRINQAPPCNKIIQQSVTIYHLHGTSLNKNKENVGRRRTARSEENIELVSNILEKNSNNLTRTCFEKYGKHID